jgi:hypothetical protein
LSALDAKTPTVPHIRFRFVIARTPDRIRRRALSMHLELPRDMADEIERLQHQDPELLERMLGYAVLRAACFEGVRDGGASQKLLERP